MVENPLTDMLIRIKNGYLAGLKTVEIPYSKIRLELAKILLKEGYLARVESRKRQSSSKTKTGEVRTIMVYLRYEGRKPALSGVEPVSKSSLRVYVKKSQIPQVLGGQGLVILTTPKGLMTGQEAQKKNLGGELICKIW